MNLLKKVKRLFAAGAGYRFTVTLWQRVKLRPGLRSCERESDIFHGTHAPVSPAIGCGTAVSRLKSRSMYQEIPPTPNP